MHDWDFTKLAVVKHDNNKSTQISICAAHTKARTVIATPIIGDPVWIFVLAYTYNERDRAALEELVELAKLGMECRIGVHCGMADGTPHDWDLSKLQVLQHNVDRPPLSICAAHTGPEDMLFFLAYTYNESDRAALEELVELAKLGMECRKHHPEL